MNLRTIFSAGAAATLLVIGPGWALAGPGANVSGDVTGQAEAIADGSGASGAGDLAGGFDGSVDAGELPAAPDAPGAPELPEPQQGDAPELPGLPELPELPAAPELPSATQPKGPGTKPAIDKGNGDASARGQGEFSVSGSVSGGNPPDATYDASGSGLVEVAGHQVTLP